MKQINPPRMFNEMKIKRATIFNSLTLLSLLAAAFVALAWLSSFSSDWELFSFLKDDEKVALHSRFGQFVLVGPPIEQVANPLPRELVFQMSNADFDWSGIGSDYVCGAARRDSPTWQVYQRFLVRDGKGMGLEPAMRIFIAQAKDDPQRFVPAHMLLVFAGQKTRAPARIPRQKWLEIGFRREADGSRIPEVIMRADPSKNLPDFAARWDIAPEWSAVMETPRQAVFHGWIWLGAIVLPIAWLTRPRGRKATVLRWSFNAFALISGILFLGSMILGVRSAFVDEQFIFSRRPRPNVGNYQLDSISSAGSSHGRLIFLEHDTFRANSFRDPWGYRQQAPAWPTKLQGLSVVGEKSTHFPGVEHYEFPSQPMNLPTTTVPGVVVPAASVTQFLYGERALAIRWWLIVLAACMIPACWCGNAILWRRRIHKEDRKLARRCPACGYDIRATPGRCPECGELIQKPTPL